LIKILDNAFSTKTRDEWLAHFKAQKAAGFLYVAIKDVSELPNDPQVLANNYIVEDDHPTIGHIKMVQFPIEFSKTAVVPGGSPAPHLGEHSEDILLELGYNRGEIAELRNQEVI
jgi:crotonobetainyl-CoA:carnitine CoA-transferase CaiB-like acyl-CoA transferase